MTRLLRALPLLLAACAGSTQAMSMLRVTCGDADAGAAVNVNGVFKGDCPVDAQVEPGNIQLRVTRPLNATHERVFEQEFRMGDGTVRRVEAVLAARRIRPQGSRPNLKLYLGQGLPAAVVAQLSDTVKSFGEGNLVTTARVPIGDVRARQASLSGAADFSAFVDAAPNDAGAVQVGFWNARSDYLGGIQVKTGPGINLGPWLIKSACERLPQFNCDEAATGELKVSTDAAKARYTLSFRYVGSDSEQTALTSARPISSPLQLFPSPLIAYISEESGQPQVYVHDLATGKRRRLETGAARAQLQRAGKSLQMVDELGQVLRQWPLEGLSVN